MITLAQPSYAGARPDPLIDIAVVDTGGSFDGNTATLKFNGQVVTPEFLPGDVTHQFVTNRRDYLRPVRPTRSK
jgi:hypothetical protein